MNLCCVCGKKGDKHHIIHKDEGGMDFPLNCIYLCEEHHRGPKGPHKDASVDASYKKLLYDTLHKLFSNPFYSEIEIKELTGLSVSQLRTLKKTLRRHKEGFRTVDVIDFLMSGHLVSEEDLEPELFLEE